MIEYSFSPVFHMTLLKVFNLISYYNRVNPREFITGSFEHG